MVEFTRKNMKVAVPMDHKVLLTLFVLVFFKHVAYLSHFIVVVPLSMFKSETVTYLLCIASIGMP